ncbi:uncharacterized protein LOC116413435 [Galleria mellonella]|uniref:Uncharacterized protein LOC116413435 n=1 Tax=Galleria mellonella TaxID=7137 RepID=A0ABM3MIC1_GALME|nr:uncharacterized protein LOC116413435 [Galleria mellonella]
MAGWIHWIVLLCGVFIASTEKIKESAGKRIQYFSTEHPRICEFDSKIFVSGNLTSRRHSRMDPFYYVDFHVSTRVPIGNNVTVHFYFYEFLTNVYKRGFIEMHMGVCDLIFKDKFFGAGMKKQLKVLSCPFPKGEYHLYNMTIPLEQIPRGFPFTKGRIYSNITLTNTGKQIASGYIDIELKTTRISN